ncbi:DMT family transporter [Vibrio superstes]|nr:DMT family transporter [Vibrio superstes]
MLLSTFSLSVTGLLSKYLGQAVPIELLSFTRFAVPCVLLYFFLTSRRLSPLPRGMLKVLLVRGACIAASQWCFLMSLQTLSLVEGIVLFSTGPLFIPLLEKMWFGASIKRTTIVALLLTFIGVILMAGDLSQFHLKAELVLGLLAGLFNAGSQLTLYQASKSTLKPVETNIWTFLFASAMMLPITLMVGWQSQGEGLWNLHTLLNWNVLFLVLLLAVLVINTQIFRSKAYQLADSGSQLAPLIYTNLLFSSVWQILFFEDAFSQQKTIGISMIVIASVYTTFSSKRLKLKLSMPLKRFQQS